MTPIVFAKFILILLGACLVVLAWGMWADSRKYPQPDLPTDDTESAIEAGLALAGLLLFAWGVAL